MNIKQVIAVRTDLNMRKGKIAAQAGHAAMSFLTTRLRYIAGDEEVKEFSLYVNPYEDEWLNSGTKKIVVGVSSEEELDELIEKANEMGIPNHTVVDSGLTEFGGIPTVTCAAFGPYESDERDRLTGSLKLI